MKFHRITALAAAVFCTPMLAMHGSAKAADAFTVRVHAEKNYVFASDLANGDIVLSGGIYLDNYTAMTNMRTVLMSDGPIVVENGDFAEPNFFAAQGVFSSYTQVVTSTSSALAGLTNVMLWNGPSDADGIPTVGVVANPDAPLTAFDVRIPQNTPVGTYRIYIRDDYAVNSVGQKEFYFYCNNGDADVAVTLQDLVITVEPDAVRGDVNSDGGITSDDAVAALRYYTANMMGQSEDACYAAMNVAYPHTGVLAADADLNGQAELQDANLILRYYVYNTVMQQTMDWDTLMAGA